MKKTEQAAAEKAVEGVTNHYELRNSLDWKKANIEVVVAC